MEYAAENRGGKDMSGRGEPLTGYRHICPVCGKEFWGSSEWKYKKSKRAHDAVYTTIYFCSWKCIRKVEKAEKQDA